MTTPTPTSNGVVGLGDSLPPGLPDEAVLGRMAAEFFRRLPGTATAAPPVSPPAPSQANVANEGSRPIAPDPVEPSGGSAYGVPEAYAAALPLVTPPAPPVQPPSPGAGFVPGSPYYFIGEASPYGRSPTVPAYADDRVSAQSFGLPGQADLKALLDEIGSDKREPERQTGPGAESSGFYFLDQRKPVGYVPVTAQAAHPPFDVNAVRKDFPILQERVNGRPLVWFDNAATTQKPQAVIDRLAYFYQHENSNIHRAAHELAARSTDAYEAARNKVARFIGADSAEEIIFVRGATEAINLVAKTWGSQNIGPGDEIIVSQLEHHANIVPWQQLAREKGAVIRVIRSTTAARCCSMNTRSCLTAKPNWYR